MHLQQQPQLPPPQQQQSQSHQQQQPQPQPMQQTFNRDGKILLQNYYVTQSYFKAIIIILMRSDPYQYDAYIYIS